MHHARLRTWRRDIPAMTDALPPLWGETGRPAKWYNDCLTVIHYTTPTRKGQAARSLQLNRVRHIPQFLRQNLFEILPPDIVKLLTISLGAYIMITDR